MKTGMDTIDHRRPGLVVYADDQYVNQQTMKMKFADIGIQDRLRMFSDGKAVTDYFENMLNGIQISQQEAQI